jgi:bacillithiol biosynthesis deacetylase BshB1
MKLDILAFGAHPDDVEIGCGATIAKSIANGLKVGIVDLTRGELGSRGTPEIRAMEAQNAAQILGVSIRENLGFADGFFINDKEHQLKVIAIIRKYKPKIVLCNTIDDRHLDHPKAGELVSNACFLSGLRKIETSLNGKSQKEWRPKQVYHYIQWKNIEPDFVVDVSKHLVKKIAAVNAYKSQLFNPNSKEPETPITTQNFFDSIKYRAQDLGRLVGVDCAEGFTTERYVAVKQLDDLF